jgi:hypothetical protein
LSEFQRAKTKTKSQIRIAKFETSRKFETALLLNQKEQLQMDQTKKASDFTGSLPRAPSRPIDYFSSVFLLPRR